MVCHPVSSSRSHQFQLWAYLFTSFLVVYYWCSTGNGAQRRQCSPFTGMKLVREGFLILLRLVWSGGL